MKKRSSVLTPANDRQALSEGERDVRVCITGVGGISIRGARFSTRAESEADTSIAG